MILPAQTRGTGAEQEPIKLENDWNEALVKSDRAFLERVLAEDFCVASHGLKVPER